MSVPVLGERADQEHDPHFLATANDLFYKALAKEDTPHWFALCPQRIPVNTPQGTVMPLMVMVYIWRKGPPPNINRVLSSAEPVGDFMSMLDPEVVESYCASICSKLRDDYFSVPR